MKVSGLRLFRIHGIDIYLHFSWWIIFFLLIYSLSSEYFPSEVEGLSFWTYWVIGTVAAACLFLSVLMHELVHSFVARARNLKVDHITLFFFGGVASLPSEDVEPGTEFLMALSGPLFSILLGVGLFALDQFLMGVMHAVVEYLWRLNIMVGFFNLMPGYPLDGGRVFRALLMFYFKDMKKATYVASMGGKVVGSFLVFLGVLSVFFGGYGGFWFVILGAFLWFMAGVSYEWLIVRQVLGKILCEDVLSKKYTRVSPTLNFEGLVILFQTSMEGSFVVEKDGKFVGLVDIRKLSSVALENRGVVQVRHVMISSDKIRCGKISDKGYDLLRRMDEQGLDAVPVVEKGKVRGVVYRRALLVALEIGMKHS